MKKNATRSSVALAVKACEDKKAENLRILQMDTDSGAFTDYFVICSGSNPRQIQAIADEVELRLKKAGAYLNQIEGYERAEWCLMDYVDFVVHIFSNSARKYYDLERLWKSARSITLADLKKPVRRAARRAAKAAARRATGARANQAKKTFKKTK